MLNCTKQPKLHLRSGPGKVLVHSINIKTASCEGCSRDQEGVRVSLRGEVIGEALAGVPCATGLLDTAGAADFSSGSVASFDGRLEDDTEDEVERRSMGTCYKVTFGEITTNLWRSFHSYGEGVKLGCQLKICKGLVG